MVKERSNNLISFSPRRLASSFYCGVLGNHLRFRPGTPKTFGLQYGTDADANIHKFYSKNKDYEFNDELEYIIKIAPPSSTAVPDEKVTQIFNIDGSDYILSGFTDVTFDEEILEVKTGKQQAWHTIQALSYAVIKNRPCRVVYITRQYSIVIQPELKRLEDIIRIAIHNENTGFTSKNEMCQYCTLKQSCIQWNEHSPYVDVLVSAKRLLDTENLLTEDRTAIRKYYNTLRGMLGKYLTINTSYVSNEYSISVSNTKDKRTLRLNKRKLFK